MARLSRSGRSRRVRKARGKRRIFRKSRTALEKVVTSIINRQSETKEASFLELRAYSLRLDYMLTAHIVVRIS